MVLRFAPLLLATLAAASAQPRPADTGIPIRVGRPGQPRPRPIRLPDHETRDASPKFALLFGGGAVWTPYRYATCASLGGGKTRNYAGSRFTTGGIYGGAAELTLPSVLSRITAGAWAGLAVVNVTRNDRYIYSGFAAPSYPVASADIAVRSAILDDWRLKSSLFLSPYIDHNVATLTENGFTHLRVGYQYLGPRSMSLDSSYYHVRYQYSSHIVRVSLDRRVLEGKRVGPAAQAGLLLGTHGLVGGFLTAGPFWSLRGKREH